MTAPTISIYPVGVLDAVKHPRRIRGELRSLGRQLKARNWRAIRQSFNGYLAEVNYPGELRHTRCGRGWTRRAAASSLGRRLAADNPDRIR